MGEHAVQDAPEQDAAMRRYVQNVVGSDGRSTADEIARLADLRDRGVISEEEFQQAKAKAIS
jgi:multidrug resistance efflux pump